MCRHHPIPEGMQSQIAERLDAVEAEIADARNRLERLDEPSVNLLDEANALFRALVGESASCC